MTDEPPKVSHEHLMVYLIGRMDEHDQNIKAVHFATVRNGVQLRKFGFQTSVMSVLIEVFRGVFTFSAQISTVFLASYVAFEHTWYVEKIGKWLHQIGSYLFWP